MERLFHVKFSYSQVDWKPISKKESADDDHNLFHYPTSLYHLWFQNLRIQELRERSLDLHRDIASAMKELDVPEELVADYKLQDEVPLFPAKIGEPEYLGNNKILGEEDWCCFCLKENLLSFSIRAKCRRRWVFIQYDL